MEKIAIIGAGAFGSALANHLSKNNQVKIWSYETKVVDEINKLHQNLTFLPDIALNKEILATNGMSEALAFSNIVINATPVFAIRNTYAGVNLDKKILLNASKGIEKGSHKLLHQVFAETVTGEYTYAVISGPSFASEVARSEDTFVTLACPEKKSAGLLKKIFETEAFKIETKTDIVGVELAGALKNVLAIASGIAMGAGLGKNFQAAIFCQGLEEMSSLGAKMGAEKSTFYSLAGLGDLFLTATSDQSRNFTFGFKIGQGEDLDQASQGKTVEGVGSSESAYFLSEKYSLKTVVFKTIYDIISKQKEPMIGIKNLWHDI